MTTQTGTPPRGDVWSPILCWKLHKEPWRAKRRNGVTSGSGSRTLSVAPVGPMSRAGTAMTTVREGRGHHDAPLRV